MAVTLSDSFGKINFADDVAAFDYSINKSDILSITVKSRKGRIMVKVKPGVLTTGQHFYFAYADITTPTVYSIVHVYNTLVRWWKEPQLNYALFQADENQRIFDCSPRLKLNVDNYNVNVDGIEQTWGHSAAGNVVSFDRPFQQYVQIRITNV